MGPGRRLAIFARAPRIGAVKRRLARDVGEYVAWRYYRNEIARLISELHPLGGIELCLAVTPDPFARRGRFWPRGVPRIPQGSGDLGARMARIVQAAPCGPVVIVGSDVPGLVARHVRSAFAALETFDAVVGPAHDGGYWLVGFSRRPALPGRWRPPLFQGVRWSGPHALQDTLATFPAAWRVRTLETLSDVDTGADLASLSCPGPLGGQGQASRVSCSSRRSINSTKLHGL